MKILIKLPAIVLVDNIGTILMAINITTTTYTMHVDIRYKYMSEYVQDGVAKIVCDMSADNDSNILAKT